MDISQTDPRSDHALIRFHNDELLVLFDWLAEVNRRDQKDAALNRLLNDLEAVLESTLWQPFSRNYSKLLAEAKRNILNHRYG